MLNKQFLHWLHHLEKGKFWAWVGHSDNASHFKSGEMMNYWAGKMTELEFLKACWIDFGCPGHGKGPWDGMGAVMKQQLTRDLTNNRILTASGYVRSPKEVAEHLRARFQTEEWKAAHVDKAIHEIVVTYSDHGEITERGRVDHEFSSLVGKMSSYSYAMLARDQVCCAGPPPSPHRLMHCPPASPHHRLRAASAAAGARAAFTSLGGRRCALLVTKCWSAMSASQTRRWTGSALLRMSALRRGMSRRSRIWAQASLDGASSHK
jgi:hypothetical protein